MSKERKKISLGNFIAELEGVVKNLEPGKGQVEVELPDIPGKAPDLGKIIGYLSTKGYLVSASLYREESRPIVTFRKNQAAEDC